MANTLLYGFQALEANDLLNQRASQVPEVQAAIEMSVAAHNQAVNDMISVFCRRTTDYTARFRSNASGVLQPLDEYGRSRPVRTSTYSVAWPIKMAGAATGFTFVSREKVTVKEVNDILSQILIADVRWVRRQILGALFTNTASGVTFADPVWGDLTCYGLANGDAAPLYYIETSDSEATDTHYLATASAIADNANPFGAIYTELKEHPENGGDVIALIPTALKATTTALTEFEKVDDGVIIAGSGTDRVSRFPSNIPAGATPLGYLEDSMIFVAEWNVLPSDIIVAYTSDGDSPLAMREDPEANLQGFRAVDRLDEFPYYGEQWFRRAGFAAWNRVGAVVQRIGNGSYAIPTGYSLLMAS